MQGFQTLYPDVFSFLKDGSLLHYAFVLVFNFLDYCYFRVFVEIVRNLSKVLTYVDCFLAEHIVSVFVYLYVHRPFAFTYWIPERIHSSK